jgi:hypothetical protein
VAVLDVKVTQVINKDSLFAYGRYRIIRRQAAGDERVRTKGLQLTTVGATHRVWSWRTCRWLHGNAAAVAALLGAEHIETIPEWQRRILNAAP